MYENGFLDFWSAYPRSTKKPRAFEAWRRAVMAIKEEKGITRQAAEDWLLERAKAFASSDTAKSGQYCPGPVSWLDDGRYDDDISAWYDTPPIQKRKPAAQDSEFEANKAEFLRRRAERLAKK